MRSRLLVAIGLVTTVLGVACAQALTFEIPQFAAAEVNAALAVDDSQPPRAELVATAAVAEAALAQADLLPATDWELTELAAALGDDPLAVQQFVLDSVALDPYSGVLRGAHGTLAARAGSTWDRALLLAALLEANGHTTRLAYSQGTVKESRLEYPAPALPMADTVAAQLDLERVRVRAARDFAMLQLALSEAGLSLDSAAQPATRASAMEIAVWVQVLQQDGSWLDLDPLGAAVAVPAGAETSTAEAVPAEHRHFVTLSVVAESLEGGETSSQVVLEQRLPAAVAAAQQLWLYFQPDAAGLGGAIADVFEGKSYVPVLMIDGETTTGAPFSLGGAGEDDFFGGFLGGGGPELVGLTLEISTEGPGQAAVTATRTLLDRVAPTDRAAGVFITELLEPLPAGGVPSALSALHHVMVSTGGANPREHAIARAFAVSFAGNELAAGAEGDYPLSDLLLPLAVADETLIVAAERGVVDGLRADGVRAYIGHARVYLSTLEPLVDQQDATSLTIDLALDGVSFITADQAVDLPGWQLWYGTLQSALETELTLARFRAVEPGTGGVASVSTAMSGQSAAGRALTIIAPGSAPTGATAAAALQQAVAAGQLAVVVGDPMRGGGFWSIDPRTGATRSVMEPGVRVGFTWGRNYTNASPGGPRWVIDPNTGNTLGYERDGKFYRYTRKPPSRCSGGTEYVVLLGCVSIPAGMTLGMTYGVIVTAIVSWATAVIELALLL